MELNLHSKLKDVLQNPVGENAINNLERYLLRHTDKNLKRIRQNTPLYKLDEVAGDGFAQRLLTLMEQYPTFPVEHGKNDFSAWWKEAIIYCVYLPSFMDADHDGVGDFAGVMQRLPYLKKLGIDTIWLSPFIASRTENGRAAIDYKNPYSEYGDMEDFEELVQTAHDFGIRVLISIDIAATSEKHPWFQAALEDSSSQWYGYYHFQKGNRNCPPNNWGNKVGGWKWFEENQSWALHMLGLDRMDLNWSNPLLRDEMAQVFRFWVNKGVDGFCLDSFSLIAKESFEDGLLSFSGINCTKGHEFCVYNPKLHDYLRELREKVQEDKKVLFMGETAGMASAFASSFTAVENNEVDMLFDLSHLFGKSYAKNEADKENFSLVMLKDYYLSLMDDTKDNRWVSLVFETAWLPRMVTRLEENPVYRNTLSKLLASLLLTLRGTPIIYQGQELGLSSLNIKEVDPFFSLDEEFGKIKQDNVPNYARAPMPWNEGLNGGFTGAKPWIQTMKGIFRLNARTQVEDENSVFNYYRQLILLRNENPVLIYGGFQNVFTRNRKLFCFFRILENEKWYIEINMAPKMVRRERGLLLNQKLVLSNYTSPSKSLRPYEANIYRCE